MSAAGSIGSRAEESLAYPSRSGLLESGTLNHLLVRKYLHQGDGIIALPPSRRKERLFGASGTGRAKPKRTGVKLERLTGSGYEPRDDSCVAAFVRLLAAEAAPREDCEGPQCAP